MYCLIMYALLYHRLVKELKQPQFVFMAGICGRFCFKAIREHQCTEQHACHIRYSDEMGRMWGGEDLWGWGGSGEASQIFTMANVIAGR